MFNITIASIYQEAIVNKFIIAIKTKNKK